jgi:hypothetical protein
MRWQLLVPGPGDDGTAAELCMGNGSPSEPRMDVTVVRGQLLINFVTSGPQEAIAVAAAKDLASSLEAAVQGILWPARCPSGARRHRRDRFAPARCLGKPVR